MTAIGQVSAQVSTRQGALLCAPESRHGNKVFYCAEGRRHPVPDAIWLGQNGFKWPDDVRQVSSDVLDAFLAARPAARRWNDLDWHNPPRLSVGAMREIAVSRLRGRGVEIGAGSSPMPVPLTCEVKYADIFDIGELQQNAYNGQAVQDLVVPEIRAHFEDLSPIPDESVDFVVACHVIEHTRDPIGAIAGAWRKLRPGGSVVLVVPEKTRTFDRDRELTQLSHLIEDYIAPDPSRVRDQQHFQEFYSKAFLTPAEEYEVTWRTKWATAFPIHYHTWSHYSFSEMIRWMDEQGVLPHLAEIWSQRPLLDINECIEFWFALRRA